MKLASRPQTAESPRTINTDHLEKFTDSDRTVEQELFQIYQEQASLALARICLEAEKGQDLDLSAKRLLIERMQAAYDDIGLFFTKRLHGNEAAMPA